MKHIPVITNKAPRAIGPYSQAVIANNFVFCSGQIGLDPVSGSLVEGGCKEQAIRALENVKAILIAAGSDLHQVVKTEIFLKNMSDFALVNEVYSTYFTSDVLPARATVEVVQLPKNALVEISCIAYI